MYNIQQQFVFFFLLSIASLSSIKGQPQYSISSNEMNSCDSIGLAITCTTCINGSPPIQYIFNYENDSVERLGEDVFIEEILVKIEHSYDSDLILNLISPSGTKVLLFDDVGGAESNFGDVMNPDICADPTHLLSAYHPDYCTAQFIEDGAAPFFGNYTTEGDLNDFHSQNEDPNGDWILEIEDNASDDDGLLIYFEIKFTTSDCLRPIIDSISSDSNGNVEIYLEDLGDCEEFIVEWGAPGFDPANESSGNGEVASFSCSTNPLVISGLEGQTPYDFYVRKKCDAVLWSDNSCLESYFTDCKSSNPTFVTNFDDTDVYSGDLDCGDQFTLPGAWMNYDSGDLLDWGVINGASNIGSNLITGSGNLIYITDDCFGRDSVLLYSPCVLVNAEDPEACHLYFDHYIKKKEVFDFFKLQISEDGGFNYTDLWAADIESNTEVWERVFINLHDYDANVVQFRFFAKQNNKRHGRIYLDNITFLGSVNNGIPAEHYYVDKDQDGYGSKSLRVPSCSDEPILGFSSNSDDCDDDNSSVHPNATEIPCNEIDDDCDISTSDLELETPVVPGPFTICSGETVELAVDPLFDVFWYDSMNGSAIGNGSIFEYLGLNNTNEVLDLEVFVEYRDGACKSSSKGMIELSILPSPDISYDTEGFGAVCFGDTVDLQLLAIQDLNGMSQDLSYYEDAQLLSSIDSPYQIELKGEEQIWIQALADNGCSDIELLSLSSVDSIGLSIIGDPIICPNTEFDLSFEVFTDNSISRILWSNGDTSISIQDALPEGSLEELYWLRVEDENACVDTASILIEEVEFNPQLEIETINVSDCDLSDGSIAVNTPGNSVFEFELHGPMDEQTVIVGSDVSFTNLSGGSYELLVNQLGSDCSYINPEPIIIYGGSVSVGTIDIEQVTCNEFSNGAISISIDNTNPFIKWSTGETDTSAIDNLIAGTYSVTISEGNCALILDDLIVEEPEPLKVSIVDITAEVSCFDFEDGSIDVLASGGASPYTYDWSNLSDNTMINELAAGTYHLTITDNNSCITEESFEINAPDPILVEAELTAPTCYGFEDGVIELNVGGGSGIYQYYLDDLLIQSEIKDLASGSYSILVKDTKGCSAEKNFDLVDVDELEIVNQQVVNSSCKGLSDGIIGFSVIGGNEGYQYIWNDGSTVSTRSALSEGHYSVTVNDHLGCSVEQEFEIFNATEVSANWKLEVATCSELSDGVLEFYNPTGVAPHDYKIYFEDELVGSDNLPEGELLFVYEDGRGCIDSNFIQHEADIAFITNVVTEPPNCKAAFTGQISLDFDENGDGPYDVNWLDDNSNSDTRSGLQEGTYIVEVTDVNLCKETIEVSLEAVSDLEITLLSVDSISCSGRTDGVIVMNASGGVEPYKYSWNNGDDGNILENVGPGTYKLNIVDDMNCSLSSEFIELKDVEKMIAEVEYHFDESYSCVNKPLDSIQLNISGGREPYYIEWSDGFADAVYPMPEQDVYEVEILDDFGCEVVLEDLTVKDGEPLLTMEFDYVNNSDYNCQDGLLLDKLRFELQTGALPVEYTFTNIDQGSQEISISDESVFILNNLDDGIYNVEVVDNNGCYFSIDSLSIQTIDALDLALNEVVFESCFETNDAVISFDNNGGLAPFEYSLIYENQISSLDDTTISGLSSGLYTFIVKDSFQCTDTLTVSIPSAPVVQVGDIVLDGVNYCYDDENVNIIGVTFTEGEEFVESLSYSHGNSNLSSGEYILTVLTEDGCSYDTNFEVESLSDTPLQLDTVASVFTNPNCITAPNGSIHLFPKGGVEPYNFVWEYTSETGSSSSFESGKELHLEGLDEGTYSVTITDANLCAIQDYSYLTIELSYNDIFTIDTSYIEVCFDESNASIKFEMDGGQMPYSIAWGDSQKEVVFSSIVDIENLAPTIYEFEVSEDKGCKFMYEVDLMKGDPIILDSFFLNDNNLIAYVDDPNSSYTYLWEGNTNIEDKFCDYCISFSEPDTFRLIVTNDLGCKETFEFDLLALINSSQSLIESSEIYLFPNPAKDKINISLAGLELKDIDLLIYNASGVAIDHLKPNAQEFEYKIPGHLEDGNYFLLVLDNGQFIGTKQFVVSR